MSEGVHASFDIVSASGFFRRVVLVDYHDFLEQKTDSRRAIHAALSAWHLHEWVHESQRGTDGYPFRTARAFGTHIRERCSPLGALRDISNGSKHVRATQNPRISDTRLHRGAFSNAFSRGFDISALLISIDDGTERYFEDILTEAIEWWQGYLEKCGLL